MRNLLFVFIVMTILISHSHAEVQTAWMDQSANPCEDFYRYANGKWLDNNPVPPDRSSWGIGTELQENNLLIVHEILEEAAKNTTSSPDSISHKVGAFYRSGMDVEGIEADGAKPLEAELQRIDAVSNVQQLLTALGRLHRMNIYPGFRFFIEQDLRQSMQNLPWLYQGGLALPDLDYYLSDEEKPNAVRRQYTAHIQKMFELLNISPESAAAEAKAVLSLEKSLAEASMTPVEQMDPQAIYNRMTFEEFTNLAGQDWRSYFTEIGLSDPPVMNIAQPIFFKQLAASMSEIPIKDWKSYLKWHLIHTHADKLSSGFVNEDFQFFGKVLTGAETLPPRWKMVLKITDQRLGEAIGQLYVKKTFGPEAKAAALELVRNLKAVLRERLSQLEWMKGETRTQALRKVDTMLIKIGYPDRWRDISGLKIDQGKFVLNVLQADEFEFRSELSKLGKPVDRAEWAVTPSTVDAGYNPSFNDLTFPAGILQPPFFDPGASDASNYGGIGMVIGHELTHAFDDIGRQFDADGNMKGWWTEEDESNFRKRAEALQNQFSDYIAIDTVHINGKLTLGENIADLGGLRIAYIAFRKKVEGQAPKESGGMTPDQQFFLAFAQSWRRNIRPEALRTMLTTDGHAPPRFRVIGSLANLPEFARAFKCEVKKTIVEIW